MNVVLAFDEGAEIGIGHRRRMEALGAALDRRGVPVEEKPIIGSISGEVVVVDSYLYRADDKSLFEASMLVAVDDLDRDMAVDVVIDPCPGSEASAHPSAARVLSGAEYLLLDPRVPEMSTEPLSGEVEHILVTMGGGGDGELAREIAGELSRRLEAEIVVAVGPWSTPATGRGFTEIATREGLATEISRADLVVCGAGVTLMESLALGRPTVASPLYRNQVRYADAVSRIGAALVVSMSEVVSATVALCGDRRRMKELAGRGPEIVDGRGAYRVAEAISTEA